MRYTLKNTNHYEPGIITRRALRSCVDTREAQVTRSNVMLQFQDSVGEDCAGQVFTEDKRFFLMASRATRGGLGTTESHS
jgi:hypothetical protein